MCIMRRDSADGRQGWNGTYCTTDYSANTIQCGRKGEIGSCPKGEAESSFVIGTSTDRGLSWQLRLAPSFMLSSRPRAVTLEHYGLVLVSGGRPPLAVWSTRDGAHWTGYDIPANHNALVEPAQRFCPEYSVGIRNVTFQQSRCENTRLFAHVILPWKVKFIILPRQAWDKRRVNSNREPRFL